MEMTPPKLIESGEVAVKKTSPSNTKNAAIGALIAAFLVCASISLTVILNDTIQSEEDVEKYLELPVLAVIPESKIHGRGEKKVKRTSGIWDIINPFAGKEKNERRKDNIKNQNLYIPITQKEKKDYQYEEAMKTLRTNIQFSGSGLKVIMLTSTMPDEGKSETSSQLAISMAQTEGRVLFIDADIRKSVLVSRFGFGQQIYGLTQYLTGQKLLGDILYHTNLPNLDIIFSGPMAPNPAELLGEDAFARLVEWARNEYDTIIIDTPPLGSVIDAAIISQRCDGAILALAAIDAVGR